ncbi:MAG: iron ABC transporter permease [Bdellovibrionales bacterium]|nr:iron ABC transporter permease [Bdellovibrionales bacterium]
MKFVTLLLALVLWGYPLGKMVFLGFASPGASLLALVDPTVLSLVLKSLAQALASSAIALGAGLVLSFPFVADPKSSVSVGRFTRFIFQMGFLMAPTVSAMAGLSWLGSQYAYQWSAVVWVHAWVNTSWVILSITDAVAGLPPSERQAAILMGSGPYRLFRYWAIPRIRMTLLQSFLQVFLLCLASFTIVALVGGGAPVETLETALAWKMRLGVMDRSGSMAIALWQGILVLLCFGIFSRISKNLAEKQGTSRPSDFSAEGSAPSIFRNFRTAVTGFFVFSWLPVLVWVGKAFQSTGIDPGLAKNISQSMAVSFGISILSAAVCAFFLVLGFFAKDPFFMSTLWVASGVSPMFLAMSWTEAGLELSGPWSVGIAQGFLYFPLAYRFLQPWVQAKDPKLIWTARSLGASAWTAWWDVEWPRLRAPVLSILAVAAAFSWGETSLSTWFFQSDPVPVSLWVSRLAGNYRFDEAQALSALLAILGATASFLWVRNARKDRN